MNAHANASTGATIIDNEGLTPLAGNMANAPQSAGAAACRRTGSAKLRRCNSEQMSRNTEYPTVAVSTLPPRPETSRHCSVFVVSLLEINALLVLKFDFGRPYKRVVTLSHIIGASRASDNRLYPAPTGVLLPRDRFGALQQLFVTSARRVRSHVRWPLRGYLPSAKCERGRAVRCGGLKSLEIKGV
jgi:hypothetical protein